jgi:hypothetical protein
MNLSFAVSANRRSTFWFSSLTFWFSIRPTNRTANTANKAIAASPSSAAATSDRNLARSADAATASAR